MQLYFLYQEANIVGRKIVAQIIEINQQTFDQNPSTLPTELFRLMRVTGFNLYSYVACI